MFHTRVCVAGKRLSGQVYSLVRLEVERCPSSQMAWMVSCHVVTVAVSRGKKTNLWHGSKRCWRGINPSVSCMFQMDKLDLILMPVTLRSVSESLCFRSVSWSITIPRWCCHVLYIVEIKKEYFTKLLFKYTLRDLSFLMRQAWLFIWISFSSLYLRCNFFLPLHSSCCGLV